MFRVSSIFCTAGLLLGSPVVLFADEPELVTLPAQEVTAFRYETIASLIPGSLSVISPESLQSVGAQSVTELLGQVPGLQLRSVTGNRMQAEVNLRGWSSNSGLRTLVLVDGMKLNRPDMRQFNWSQIPVESIEQVEVLRGSQTTLYGSQAVGGVIKITTRKSSADPYAKVSATLGSFGLYGVSLDAGVANPQGYANGSIGYTRQDGYRENSLWEQKTATIGAGMPLGTRTELDLRTTLSTNYQQFPGPLGTTQFKSNPRLSVEPGRDSEEQFYSANFHLTQRVDSEQRFETAGGYSNSQVDWNLDGIYADSTARQFSLSPQWIATMGPLTSIVGIDLQRDELNLDRFNDKARTLPSGQAAIARDSMGGFFHHSYDLTKTLTATFGARLETNHLTATINEAPDPSTRYTMGSTDWSMNTGLTWQALQHLRFWTRLDRLYRYPVADEVAAYQGVSLATPFNTELKPERGWNVEAGAEWNRDRWKITANSFIQWLQGEIDYDSRATSPQSTTTGVTGLNRNLPDTRRIGAETTIDYRMDDWTFSADASWIEAIYTAGQYKGNARYLVPTWQLGYRVEWHPLKEIGIGMDYRYTSGSWGGEDFSNTKAKLRPYGILGAQIRYKPVDRMEVFLRGTNLTNKRYATVQYYGGWYPAEGRAFQTGLSWRF